MVANVSRSRQRFAIDFRVKRERQSIKLYNCRRDHVVRQLLLNLTPQFSRIDPRAILCHYVSHQTRIARLIFAQDNDGLRDLAAFRQRGFDFAKLDSKPAQLYLSIGATETLNPAVRKKPSQIASLIQTGVWRISK